MSDKIQTEVLLVGLGPVGAALANLLGRFGVKVLAIDKATEIFQAPRAIALDNEALRVLQMCGVQEHDIDTVAIPEVRMHSPIFGCYSRARTAGAIDGHPKLVTFYQPQLEAVLRERLAAYPQVRVALGVTLEGLTQTPDGVRAILTQPDGRTQEVAAAYVVGADGANSLVRRLLGLEFQGKTYAEDWLVVDAAGSPTPIDHVEFICDPRRPTPHMVAPGGRQRWEFKLQPGETRDEMERPDKVRSLLAPWSRGQELAIERVAVYRFHARVADTFHVGRVFLVGDAAHITPPFVGQGLVAGLRDVANLGWKLAWVLQGRAGPALLGSYTSERRPHAREMVRLAQWMGRLVMPGNTAQAFLTHGTMKLLSAVPRLRDLFENLEVKPANRLGAGCYVRGRACRSLRRGQPLPQGWFRAVQQQPAPQPVLSDDALGAGFTVLGVGVDPRAGLSREARSRWAALGGGFAMVVPRGRPADVADVPTWEDLDGALVSAGVPLGHVAIVRPDRFVMHDGPAVRLPDMLAQCMGMLAAA